MDELDEYEVEVIEAHEFALREIETADQQDWLDEEIPVWMPNLYKQ